MKKYKERTYIDNTAKKALFDLDIFYQNAKKQIKIEASNIKNDYDYLTLNFEMKVENREISRLHRFYRGAVLPYYIRQREENFDKNWVYTKEKKDLYTKEIKEQIGFFTYNYKGERTDYNSFAVFEETRRFVEVLKDIEEVIFDRQGMLFPNSEHYKELEKKYGKNNAPNIVIAELVQWWKNRTG